MFRHLNDFEYYLPKTIKELTDILQKKRGKAKILAGGCELITNMRAQNKKFKCLISLSNLDKLRFICCDDNFLRIGAMATLIEVENFKNLKQTYTALYESLQAIVQTPIKTTGTLIGNLCTATPASDIAPALIILSAKIKISNGNNNRLVNLENFYISNRKTCLKTNEFVSEVIIPKISLNSKSSFLALVRTAADISKISVAVFLNLKNNYVNQIKIALGSVASKTIRAFSLENKFIGKKLSLNFIKQQTEFSFNEINPISDIRSTAKYRKKMINILLKKLLCKLI